MKMFVKIRAGLTNLLTTMKLSDIRGGVLVRHKKGGLYMIDGIVKHSETLEVFVSYHKWGEKGDSWVRPLEMFLEEGRFILYE